MRIWLRSQVSDGEPTIHEPILGGVHCESVYRERVHTNICPLQLVKGSLYAYARMQFNYYCINNPTKTLLNLEAWNIKIIKYPNLVVYSSFNLKDFSSLLPSSKGLPSMAQVLLLNYIANSISFLVYQFIFKGQ